MSFGAGALHGGVHDPSGKLGGGGYHQGGAGSLAAKLASKPGVRNPGGLAAAIDRRIRQHGPSLGMTSK